MFRMRLCHVLLFSLATCLAPFSLAAPAPQETTEQVNQLDINHADATAIAAALVGVGVVKAEEIVAYREMFGSFTSVDELLEVSGIGVATLERNRHRIVIVQN